LRSSGEAETLVLVAVAISPLGESLVAKCAREGAQALVRAHMVLHVAQLRELLAASQALEHLVFATGILIQILHFPEAFRFLDGITRLFDGASLLVLAIN